MFKLYLFFSDMRDYYNLADENESASILDMAHKLWLGMSKEQLLALREACYKMIILLNEELSRF